MLHSGNSIANRNGMQLRSRTNNVYKGLAAGALGGLAAAWIMTRFQVLLAHALGLSDPHGGQEEDATVNTAQKISAGVLHHELSPEEKKVAGPLVHYGYGAGLGILYGGLAQRSDKLTSGFGTAYGAAVWALGDEVAVPALGLGRGPTETPVSEQVQTLAAHVLYGITLEGVRRVALKVL